MLNNYRFKSVFKEELKYFIKYQKSLGYIYENEINILKHLDMDLCQLKLDKKKISPKIYEQIIKRNEMSEGNYARHYRTITNFLKFLVNNGYKNIYYEVKKFHITNNYKPIIFNIKEINKLFETMDKYALSTNKRYYQLNYTYSIIFRLIYSCGLRVSEALNIHVKDISFRENTIDIIDSKNHVSRKIIISDSMKKCLITYINKFNISDILFINRRNKQICYHTLRLYYKQMISLAKLNTKATIHCLRHTFVNTSFNQMLEKGYDEAAIILYLHKYLGHKSIYETEYYLHFTDYNRNKILKINDDFSKELYKGII